MPAAPATSDDHKKEGNELFAKGDFLRAAAAYTRGIKAAPDSHVLYSNRAQAFLRLHKVGKALEDADRCIALAPDFVKGYHRKASALHALGEPARSEEASGLATPPSLAILPAASASRLPLTPASLAGSLAALTPPPSPHVLAATRPRHRGPRRGLTHRRRPRRAKAAELLLGAIERGMEDRELVRLGVTVGGDTPLLQLLQNASP